jgi:hypothetical protein
MFKTPAVRVEILRPGCPSSQPVDSVHVLLPLQRQFASLSRCARHRSSTHEMPVRPTEAHMKVITLVPILMLAAGLALPASPARALTTTWQECQVIEVRTYANRVHVLCAWSDQVFGPYFAVPTSSSAEATRLVTLGTASLMGGGRLRILLGLDDFTGPSYGCLINDCRRPLEVILSK